MASADWFNLKRKGGRAFSSPKTKEERREFEKLLAYQTSRGRSKRFPMRKDSAPYFGVRWEMDLLDLGGKKSFNAPSKGEAPKRYALVIYDVFSKAFFARALADRQGKTVVAALENIFKNLRPPYPNRPLEIQCDEGGEFKNEAVKKFMAEKDVRLTYVRGPRKNQSVERAIRSFKKVAVPYMEHYKNATWENCVRAVANFLNGRENRVIGMSPDQAASNSPSDVNLMQEKTVDENSVNDFSHYKKDQSNFVTGKSKYSKGDWVLVAHDKTPYEKETVRNYLYKPFKIVGASMERRPYLYYLQDSKGKKGLRAYYAREMRKIKNFPLSGKLPLAGILDRREGSGGKEEWLARFVDHGKEFDKWIEARKFEHPPEDEKEIAKGEKPIKQTRDKRGARKKQAGKT